MRKLLLALLTLSILPFYLHAETKITSIKKASDGLYLMHYDTSADNHFYSKSAIVEFKNFIVLVEMPLCYSNASPLKDHIEGGEKVLQALKKEFPNKPLKYVLSSHWHPHSISSIIPFVSSGVTVVTTRNNFKHLSEFIDSATYEKYRDHIHFVEEDSMVIKDKTNTIIAYKCNKKEYTNQPTEDFLYFYFPKYRCLQTSCMYQRYRGFKAKGKELISGRTEDLNKFIRSKNIAPQTFLCTENYFDDANDMASNDTLQSMFSTGIGASAIKDEIMSMSDETLQLKSDSVIKYFANNTIPVYLLNEAVYTTLRNQNLNKALALARLQALINPSDPNVWDTFGEVYYFMGEQKLAKKYATQTTRIDKNFKGGGEQTWQKDLEDYQKIWSNK